MTTFAEQVAGDDLDVFFNPDEFAETVTYNGVDIIADVQLEPGASNDVVGYTGTLKIAESDVPSPSYRDTVVKNGNTLHLDSDEFPKSAEFGMWTLPISSERPII